MPNNTIWVEFRGKKHTLFEVAKILGIKYATIYARYRNNLELDMDLIWSRDRGCSDQTALNLERKAKHCGQCREYKSFNEFHRNIATTDQFHSICKKCRGDNQYQKQLRDKRTFGAKNIRECVKCERLFAKPMHNTYLCRRCRREPN